jgi:hypothetical protein
MRVADLSRSELRSRLRGGDLQLDIHPFVARIRTDLPTLAADIARMYADFQFIDGDAFADFHIDILAERRLAGAFRPQARFYYDGKPSFLPLPRQHALPMLEWGLNWCVASHAHQYLIIHAAVLERGGRALILPAPPGAGKSTLTAGLIHRGWRLLSDELALYDMASGLLWGMSRPVNLKNRSIEIMARFAPQALLSEPVPDTAKGMVALMAPTADSVARRREPAKPAWVVLPRYAEGRPAQLSAAEPARTLLLMAEQSFNYDIHGVRGFDAMGDLIGACRCLQFEYSSLDDAAAVFADLAAN